MDKTIFASLIVDDFPACPIYQTRAQGAMLGFEIAESGYAAGWQEMTRMKLFPVKNTRWFADFIEEFDIRGKFTCLGMPAGFGRIDQRVRGYSDEELKETLTLVRERIAPRFDITPETLTHTLAGDAQTGAMLPHSETAWMSFLARTGKIEELAKYIGQAFEILANAGLKAHGITMGGMPDLSGIGAGESLTAGWHREALAKALLLVEKRFNPETAKAGGAGGAGMTFMYSGAEPLTEACKATRLPEEIYTSETGMKVYDVFSRTDPLWYLMHGRGDAAAAVDKCITHDLSQGSLVEDAEAGRAVVITVHSFTLDGNGTGVGMRVLREIVRRLRGRYGKRLEWKKCSALCRVAG